MNLESSAENMKPVLETWNQYKKHETGAGDMNPETSAGNTKPLLETQNWCW